MNVLVFTINTCVSYVFRVPCQHLGPLVGSLGRVFPIVPHRYFQRVAKHFQRSLSTVGYGRHFPPMRGPYYK